MAYPSGSGTELAKRTTIHAQSNTATAFRWDGTMATTGTSTYTVTANHIITVLGISFCDQGDAAEAIDMYMNDGGNDITLLQSQPLPAFGTFVWNDRFILTGGDKLIINAGSSANIDVICNYVDTDWR